MAITSPIGTASRILGFGLAAVTVASLILLASARPAEAAENVFTVDRGDDPSPTSLVDNCTAGVANDCSLRGAIEKANRTANDAAGADTINFSIGTDGGVKTISPTSSLPAITDMVTIDGYTQPGASERTVTNNGPRNAVLKIELSGASAGPLGTGLFLDTGAGGTKIRGLAINRFNLEGVAINAENTVIEGNFIGTNPAGTAAGPGNRINGVRMVSSGNLIGGTSTEATNVISGNGDNGVVIAGQGASNNRIEGNRIGTDADGTSALGNEQGVNIASEASGNFVGKPGAGNLIAGNTERGVLLAGDAADNSVQSNFIGTNGTADLGNGQEGVEIFEGSNNVIGGTLSNQGNIISGNGADGVELNVGANDNNVQGNLIGTGQNGASDLGNDEVGVLVRGSGNLIGGTAPLARNVVSGNGGVGVSMLGTGASNNTVQGNRIGIQANGTTPLPNFHGVSVSDSKNNTIGGTTSSAANTISGNTNQGVQIVGASATANRILRNSIFDNGLLGIELNNDGVTLNDAKDTDAGPNNRQNFPVITSASTTQVKGTLTSTKKKTFTVQLFSNPQPNFPTGFGEGQTFLGEVTARTNKKGKASFTLNAAVPAGQIVTATATDAAGNTSEFSQGRAVQ